MFLNIAEHLNSKIKNSISELDRTEGREIWYYKTILYWLKHLVRRTAAVRAEHRATLQGATRVVPTFYPSSLNNPLHQLLD